jgi:hypothetical protein
VCQCTMHHLCPARLRAGSALPGHD